MYSNVVTVVRTSTSISIGNVRPNPTNGSTTIQFNAVSTGQINLTITGVDGKVTVSRAIEAVNGINNFEMDLGGLSNGVYYISLDNGSEKAVTKIVKAN